jgi:hypothetical protein
MARSPAASLPLTGIASVNELRDKARFKSALDEIFGAFTSRTDPSAPPSFIGAAYDDPLEHTTRKTAGNGSLPGLRVSLRVSPSTPSAMNRACHRHTTGFDLPDRHMISAVPQPRARATFIFEFCGYRRVTSPLA